MASNLAISLPPDIVERCFDYGRRMVGEYERPRSIGNACSLALASHGAEKNALLQARSKMAECAFCLWFDLNPNDALRWDCFADQGWDIRLNNLLFDIKWSAPNARFLIWPINKRHLFQAKRFDRIVLVTGIEPEFSLRGWISKHLFEKSYQVAVAPNPLTAGTWFLPVEKLYAAATAVCLLPALDELAATTKFNPAKPKRESWAEMWAKPYTGPPSNGEAPA